MDMKWGNEYKAYRRENRMLVSLHSIHFWAHSTKLRLAHHIYANNESIWTWKHFGKEIYQIDKVLSKRAAQINKCYRIFQQIKFKTFSLKINFSSSKESLDSQLRICLGKLRRKTYRASVLVLICRTIKIRNMAHDQF